MTIGIGTDTNEQSLLTTFDLAMNLLFRRSEDVSLIMSKHIYSFAAISEVIYDVAIMTEG